MKAVGHDLQHFHTHHGNRSVYICYVPGLNYSGFSSNFSPFVQREGDKQYLLDIAKGKAGNNEVNIKYTTSIFNCSLP